MFTSMDYTKRVYYVKTWTGLQYTFYEGINLPQ